MYFNPPTLPFPAEIDTIIYEFYYDQGLTFIPFNALHSAVFHVTANNATIVHVNIST